MRYTSLLTERMRYSQLLSNTNQQNRTEPYFLSSLTSIRFTIMYKVKILLIGPVKSGKSTIANFLSEAADTMSNDYRATRGVRILEFESPNVNVNGKFVTSDVELWDCSGNLKFQQHWPALQYETNGVVLVYKPTVNEHGQLLEMFYNYFVIQSGLSARSCMVLANVGSDAERDSRKHIKLPDTFSKVLQIIADVDGSGNRLRTDFGIFLSNVFSGMREKHEEEELNVMNVQAV
ncbi:intraflagellar transport protein 22 homolog isoform X2 [Schistocerca piceifrons]|uniref:intraflagellar transport protein 22 homolog isoform X2 n=1 Tax=Schistocerca piceifrons TaxID=274613 RepID=UPI001F5E9E88|nr:intraflagellar transport protein 22 homolog isoform X2 [Schistocerca piceifrons]